MRPTDVGFCIVSHPFIQSMFVPDVKNKGKLINIFEDRKGYRDYLKFLEKQIDRVDKIGQMFLLVTKAYRMTFFKYINQYLSQKDFGDMLGNCWVGVEVTYDGVNVSRADCIDWFKKAKPEYLMFPDELKVFRNLPDKIKVYHGTDSTFEEDDMSWSLSKKTAIWFANRFTSKNPRVESKIVDKSNVLAYFGRRGESEIVVG